MSASNIAPADDNRFQSLTPASLSRTEKSSVVTLALKVLSQRYRPAAASPGPRPSKGFCASNSQAAATRCSASSISTPVTA